MLDNTALIRYDLKIVHTVVNSYRKVNMPYTQNIDGRPAITMCGSRSHPDSCVHFLGTSIDVFGTVFVHLVDDHQPKPNVIELPVDNARSLIAAGRNWLDHGGDLPAGVTTDKQGSYFIAEPGGDRRLEVDYHELTQFFRDDIDVAMEMHREMVAA